MGMGEGAGGGDVEAPTGCLGEGKCSGGSSGWVSGKGAGCAGGVVGPTARRLRAGCGRGEATRVGSTIRAWGAGFGTTVGASGEPSATEGWRVRFRLGAAGAAALRVRAELAVAFLRAEVAFTAGSLRLAALLLVEDLGESRARTAFLRDLTERGFFSFI